MENLNWVEAAWQQALEKIEKLSLSIGAAFPNGSMEGRYTKGAAHDWVSGFWPGLLKLNAVD